MHEIEIFKNSGKIELKELMKSFRRSQHTFELYSSMYKRTQIQSGIEDWTNIYLTFIL